MANLASLQCFGECIPLLNLRAVLRPIAQHLVGPDAGSARKPVLPLILGKRCFPDLQPESKLPPGVDVDLLGKVHQLELGDAITVVRRHPDDVVESSRVKNKMASGWHQYNLETKDNDTNLLHVWYTKHWSWQCVV